MNKNIWLLAAGQIFGFSAATVTIFLSGIIGSQLSPIKSLATLPISLTVVGTAIFTIFAAKIMSKIGRKLGFILSSIGSSLFSLLAAYAIINQNFILFCFASFLIGTGIAFTHQYRFAAAESVEKDKIPKAISIIMFAGILSAFIGPNVANYTKDFVNGYLYVGSYLSLSVLTFIPTILLIFYSGKSKINFNIKYAGRSYFQLISQPRFLQAIISAAFAYSIMAFLMTATPISMHVMEKISLGKTGIVIQLHIVGMFLPSLITGQLIKKYGHSNIMYSGVILFVVTIIMGLFEQTFINYLIALIFLGLGWNFLFISGTSLLIISYKEEEKFKAQGLNDILVFSTQAIASLSAGFLLTLTSWKSMNLICIPFLILIIITTFRAENLVKTNK